MRLPALAVTALLVAALPATAFASPNTVASPNALASQNTAAAAESGLHYLQSATNGLNASASASPVPLRRPKGNEDRQQWNVVGDTLQEGGRCLGRSGDQAVLLACDSADARWEVVAEGSSRVLKVPGQSRYLTTEGEQARVGTRRDTWFLNPVSPTRVAVPQDGSRRLDQVTFLTAHNAYANGVDGGFAPPFINLAPNQARGVEQQLADGVRAFQLDVHQTPDGAILCHNSCTLVSGPVALNVDLRRLVDFLGRNPSEVVTVFLEDYVSVDVLRAELAKVPGLANVLFRPDQAGVRQNGWPTLDALRASGKRLLIFSDEPGRDSLGAMFQPDWTVENYWSMGAGVGNSDWSCYSRWSTPLTRTEPGFTPLFVMNHFRDVPFTGTATSDNGKLADRARRFCEPAARKTPNYLAVDHYHLGNALSAVAELSRDRFQAGTR